MALQSRNYLFPTHVYIKKGKTMQLAKATNLKTGENKSAVVKFFETEGNSSTFLRGDVLQKNLQTARNRYFQRSQKLINEAAKDANFIQNESDLFKYEENIANAINTTIQNSPILQEMRQTFVDDLNADFRSKAFKSYGDSKQHFQDINQYIEELENIKTKISQNLEYFSKSNKKQIQLLDPIKLQLLTKIDNHIKNMKSKYGNNATPANLNKIIAGGYSSVVQGAIGELLAYADATMVNGMQDQKITGTKKGTVFYKDLNKTFDIGGAKPDVSGLYFYTTKNNDASFTTHLGLTVKEYTEHYNEKGENVGAHIHLTKDAPAKRFLMRLENQYFIAMNILAHYGETNKLYENLARYLAASYIDEFLAGSWGTLDDGTLDAAQIMIYNGHAYPVSEVLSALASAELVKRGSRSASGTQYLSAHLTRSINVRDWRFNTYLITRNEGKEDYSRNDELAMQRSKIAIGELLNDVKISVSLHSDAIKRILKNTRSCGNISPILDLKDNIEKSK